MKINYRILNIDEKERSIIVRYYTDIITEEKLCILREANNDPILTEQGYPVNCRTDYNINIWDLSSPTEEQINNMIMHSAPIDWLRMQEAIANNDIDTSLSTIEHLVSTSNSFTIVV